MAGLLAEVRVAMNIIGFDLSSRKIAMMDLGLVPRAKTFAVKKKAARRDELRELEELLHEELEKGYLGDWAFIEAPVVGRGGARPTILQAQVDGIIQAATVRYGLRGGYSVNNKTWKREVVGNGNASKAEAAAWLATHHPVLADVAGDDQDLVDAACVALYGEIVIGRGESLSLLVDP